MADGVGSRAYVRAIVDSIPSLATWLLNDDSFPVNVQLYKNDIIPDPTLGDIQFDPPTYPGYAAQEFPLLGQDPVIVNEPGTGNLLIKLGPGNIFKPTSSPSSPETIFGWHVSLTPGGSTFIVAGRFTTPVVFTSSDDYVEVEACVRIMLEGINAVDQANL